MHDSTAGLQPLANHVSKFISVSDERLAEILSCFDVESFPKKQIILREGQRCDRHYFVLKGCMRLYFINEKGLEDTTQFAIESWWITDNNAFERHAPASFNIQTIEACTLASLSHESQETLLREYPEMERYFRRVFQRAFAAMQFRVRFQHEMSKEEAYRSFIAAQPGFAQRVPQYLLASYLGLTPEYLSEIRRKSIS
jgi:CRP-like cAMP-binding protein